MRPSLLLAVSMMSGCFSPAVEEVPKAHPSAAHFTLECPGHAVGAFDAARSLIAGEPLDCNAHVGDRTGAPIAGVAVSFYSEAGRVRALGLSSEIGSADAEYETALPLPRDTTPGTFIFSPQVDKTHTGVTLVPLWMEPMGWTTNPLATVMTGNPPLNRNNLQEPRRLDPLRKDPATGQAMVNNPRDNLVTVIAVVVGDEEFTDSNGNGTHDPDEAFVDLTEPFVDSNDDGTWDSQELFIDANGNGVWDGKNDRWDRGTQIWAGERVLWTGAPADRDWDHPEPVMALAATLTLTCPNQTAGAPCPQASAGYGGMFIADPWFNLPAHHGASDGCRLADASPSPVVMQLTTPGVGLTYPAGVVTTVQVTDVRDPADPSTQVPTRSPPLQFSRELICDYTASPHGGHVVEVRGWVSGTTQ